MREVDVEYRQFDKWLETRLAHHPGPGLLHLGLREMLPSRRAVQSTDTSTSPWPTPSWSVADVDAGETALGSRLLSLAVLLANGEGETATSGTTREALPAELGL
jgi:hypothetical protein